MQRQVVVLRHIAAALAGNATDADRVLFKRCLTQRGQGIQYFRPSPWRCALGDAGGHELLLRCVFRVHLGPRGKVDHAGDYRGVLAIGLMHP